MSFNTTDNEIENRLGDYSIIPAVIDDKMVAILASSNKVKNAAKMASFLFRLSEGHIKGRMNSKNSYQEFNCPVIMTTETSIIDEMLPLQVDGQYCRVIEIVCKKGELTSSDKHANELNQFMKSQGGTIIEGFITVMMMCQRSDLEREYNRIRTSILNDLNKRRIPDRARNRIAMLLLAAELLKQVFNFEININNLKQLLVENIQIAFTKAETPENRYKQLVQYCINNISVFPDEKSKANKKQHLGLLQFNSVGRKELLVSGDVLNFILTGSEPQIYLEGLENNQEWKFAKTDKALDANTLNNVLSKWADKGYLNTGIKVSSKGARTERKTLFCKEGQELVYRIFIN